jgi:hypothetical protein
MRAWWTFGVVALLVLASGFLWLKWKHDEPRRNCLQTLSQLDTALRTGNSPDLLKLICTPAAIQGRTAPEQAEFLTKALADEISPEGLVVLQREGQFGVLRNLFPAEAEGWAKQAGVKSEDCVAFKLERNGLRAEVVLTAEQDGRGQASEDRSQPERHYRIVRLNNVKQLAPGTNARANGLEAKTP